jgi:selenocysteine lyase/cysteine desulfurase
MPTHVVTADAGLDLALAAPARAAVVPGHVRNLFEIPEDVAYLNCANMAPQLRAITQAGVEAVRMKAAPWRIAAGDWFSAAEQLRALAARLLVTDSDNIALVPAVSYGIAVAAANVNVAPGQTIVLLEQEFPSNVYAWRALAHTRGATVVTVRRSARGWTAALEECITAHTAVVAVPHCHWIDGSLVDLERIGSRTREVGAALVVDASQSLGARALNLARVQPDFLVAVGYKWLLGPYGLGYLYVAPKWQRSGTPLEQSWLTRRGSEDFARLIDYTDEYRGGARRFDQGEFPQFVLVPMAVAALSQVLSWSIERIERSLQPLTDRLAEIAPSAGYTVLPAAQRCAHMIGLRHRSGVPPGVAERLKHAKIFVSVRGDSVRVAPHLYNSIEDVERLVDVLRATASD